MKITDQEKRRQFNNIINGIDMVLMNNSQTKAIDAITQEKAQKSINGTLSIKTMRSFCKGTINILPIAMRLIHTS